MPKVPQNGHPAAAQSERKPWHKPQLERLGTVRDIAVLQTPMMQAVNGKFS